MHESVSAAQPSFSRAALVLGCVLVAGLAGLALASLAGSHSAPEQFREITALGDLHYFSPPAANSSPGSPGSPGSPSSPQGKAVASFNGQSFALANAALTETVDTRMVRFGKDPVTGLYIYQPADPADFKQSKNSVALDPQKRFLKTAPGQFVEIRRD